MLRRPLVPALGMLALVGAACSEPGPPPPPPNVVLISVDTLRADHLGLYGHPRPTSPHVDAFAAEATVFEDAAAHSSETRASMASLLTGFHPHETRVMDLDHLPAGVETLAEILQRHGYATAAVVSNYVLRGDRGWDQGFERFDDEMQSRESARDYPERVATATTERALALLPELGAGPFFLWVHYQDPHGPYTPPAPFDAGFDDPGAPERTLELNASISGLGGIPAYQALGEHRDVGHYLSQYEGEIAYCDAQIGRLLDGLRERGLFDDALIVFTADHGESLGERNNWFAHMDFLYAGLTRVPLVVRFGDAPPSRRTERVQHADLLPTILAFAGVPGPELVRGRDLRTATGDAPEIFAEVGRPLVRDGARTSLVRNGFRLVHTLPEDRFELYDLKADPKERNDLARSEEHALRLANLRRRLLRLEAEDRVQAEAAEQAYTEEELRHLEALGYVR